jgi:chondroitin AC lyase
MFRVFASVFLVLFLLAPAAAATTTTTTDMDLNALRTRLIASVIPTDAALIEKLKSDAVKHAASLRPAAPGRISTTPTLIAPIGRRKGHAQRVLNMSKCFRISANLQRADAALLKQTLAALDYWLANDFQNPNWWHNQIGTPQLIGESAVLIGAEHLSAAQRDKIDAIMARSTWARWTGQNLVWGVTNQILRGLIKRDAGMITQAYDRFYAEIVITPREGIQPDYSFHQHHEQFYSGGYGLAFSMDVARYTAIAWGSRWQIPPEKLDVFNGFMLDGQRWMMHYDRFDHSAVGREIVRRGLSAVPHDWTGGPITPRGAAYALANAVRLLADQPVPRRAEYRDWLRSLTARPVDDAAADAANAANALPLIGNRHFWRSDYMVHHRPGWMASVRMFSDRLINTEMVNDEGKKSQHLADGANFLYLSGNEYTGIFPAWDWTKIPGTTAEQNTLDFEDGKEIGVKGKTSFVGGVSDGACGLACMDLHRGDLRAKKSWFFFDNSYTALGAGITSATDNPIATTINQCHLTGEVKSGEAKQGERWFHHANVGYVLPGSSPTSASPPTSNPATGPTSARSTGL